MIMPFFTTFTNLKRIPNPTPSPASEGVKSAGLGTRMLERLKSRLPWNPARKLRLLGTPQPLSFHRDGVLPSLGGGRSTYSPADSGRAAPKAAQKRPLILKTLGSQPNPIPVTSDVRFFPLRIV